MDRPTHFLALRVSHHVAVKSMKAVQNEIIAADPALECTLVAPGRFHVTVAVLTLPSAEAVATAHEALRQCASLVHHHFHGDAPRLKFKGVSTFGGRVLYAGVEEGDDEDKVATFAERVHACFAAKGLTSKPWKEFTAHCTLAKVRPGMPPGLSFRLGDLLTNANRRVLGEHVFPRLSLCSMLGGSWDVFYPVLATVALLPGRVDQCGHCDDGTASKSSSCTCSSLSYTSSTVEVTFSNPSKASFTFRPQPQRKIFYQAPSMALSSQAVLLGMQELEQQTEEKKDRRRKKRVGGGWTRSRQETPEKECPAPAQQAHVRLNRDVLKYMHVPETEADKASALANNPEAFPDLAASTHARATTTTMAGPSARQSGRRGGQGGRGGGRRRRG